MNTNIQLFGIQAQLNLIEMEQGLGTLKQAVFTCRKEVTEKIINAAVKAGLPFERTINGVNVYQ